jgi:hypothetical protein
VKNGVDINHDVAKLVNRRMTMYKKIDLEGLLHDGLKCGAELRMKTSNQRINDWGGKTLVTKHVYNLKIDMDDKYNVPRDKRAAAMEIFLLAALDGWEGADTDLSYTDGPNDEEYYWAR